MVHMGPALDARFTEYTAEFETGGELGSTTTLILHTAAVRQGQLQPQRGRAVVAPVPPLSEQK
jgi:hypothetical protein